MEGDRETRVKQVMARVFNLPTEQIGPGFSVKTSPLWDSLHHINLIVALEEEFGISLADDVVIEMHDYAAVLRAVGVAG